METELMSNDYQRRSDCAMQGHDQGKTQHAVVGRQEICKEKCGLGDEVPLSKQCSSRAMRHPSRASNRKNELDSVTGPDVWD